MSLELLMAGPGRARAPRGPGALAAQQIFRGGELGAAVPKGSSEQARLNMGPKPFPSPGWKGLFMSHLRLLHVSCA